MTKELAEKDVMRALVTLGYRDTPLGQVCFSNFADDEALARRLAAEGWLTGVTYPQLPDRRRETYYAPTRRALRLLGHDKPGTPLNWVQRAVVEGWQGSGDVSAAATLEDIDESGDRLLLGLLAEFTFEGVIDPRGPGGIAETMDQAGQVIEGVLNGLSAADDKIALSGRRLFVEAGGVEEEDEVGDEDVSGDLNEFQRAALATYLDGKFAHVGTMAEAELDEELGQDFLFLALLEELGECDEADQACDVAGGIAWDAQLVEDAMLAMARRSPEQGCMALVGRAFKRMMTGKNEKKDWLTDMGYAADPAQGRTFASMVSRSAAAEMVGNGYLRYDGGTPDSPIHFLTAKGRLLLGLPQ